MNKQLVTMWVAVMSLVVSIGVTVGMVWADNEKLELVCEIDESAWCVAPRSAQVLDDLGGATVPRIATPLWMAEQERQRESARVINYDVKTRGTLRADLVQFKQLSSATLNDSRGWAKLGLNFKEVVSGGDFTLWLVEASTMTSFSADGCDATYSCNVGRDVIINQDRWLTATPSWNGVNGSLRDYRHMVVNHETGHWLGHGHRHCAQPGAAAPVMQQQSMDMQGCQPNPWPLSDELYAPNLGIET